VALLERIGAVSASAYTTALRSPSGSDVFAVGEWGTILHYSCVHFSYLSLVLKTR
jgi:hypothetical protein